MTETKQQLKGLTNDEVIQSRAKYGSNSISKIPSDEIDTGSCDK